MTIGVLRQNSVPQHPSLGLAKLQCSISLLLGIPPSLGTSFFYSFVIVQRNHLCHLAILIPI